MKIIPYFVDVMPSRRYLISHANDRVPPSSSHRRDREDGSLAPQRYLDDRAEIIGKKLCENLKLLENFADNVL